MADASLPSFDEDDLTRLRSRIYEAIGDLDEMPGALLAAARRLGAAHVGIAIPTFDPGLGYFYDAVATDMDMVSAYAFASASGTMDPWSEATVARFHARRGLILIGDQICSRETVLKSPWQSSILIPNDCGDPLISMLAPIDDRESPVAVAVFWRSRRSPRFEIEAADRLRLFAHDIERMVQVAFKLRARRHERALLLAALNRIRDAVLVVRADCKVVFSNDAAAAAIERSVGVVVRDGRLVASNEAHQERLAHAVKRAARFAEGGNIAIARPGGLTLMATIAPTPGDTADRFGAGAAAIVTIVDPDRSGLGEQTLGRDRACAAPARDT